MWNVWRSESGDPDLLGWATTLAYLIAAALCARTAAAARRAGLGVKDPDRPAAWRLLAAGLLALGLNKQLDLQILVRETGMGVVRLIGIEQHRRWVGRAFVLVMALFLLRVLAAAAGRLRRSTRGHRLLLTGLAFLASFAVVRAGTYIPLLKEFNLRFTDALHLVFELGGIVLVGLSAFRTRQRLLRHHSSSMSSA